jgi:hypothetical protein
MVTRLATSMPSVRVKEKIPLVSARPNSARAAPGSARFVCHQPAALLPTTGRWANHSGVPRPCSRTSPIQRMTAPLSRAAWMPSPISGSTNTNASTSVSTAAMAVLPMPRPASIWRSGQVAIASTQAQVNAGRKRHSIQTFTATMAMISAVRATRCLSQCESESPVTPSPLLRAPRAGVVTASWRRRTGR